MKIKQKEESQLAMAFPPGDFLAEWLEDQNMGVKQFADLCGKPEADIQKIIEGGHVSPEMAMALEKVTKMPARIWNSLQETFDNYAKGLAKKRQHESLQIAD